MVNNFIDLQKRNGCIPNGNRVYYSSRSQPPVLALMLAMLWDAKYKFEADLPSPEKPYRQITVMVLPRSRRFTACSLAALSG